MRDPHGVPSCYRLAYLDIRVVFNAQGLSIVIPAIATETAAIESLVDYFVHFSLTRSLSWMVKVREAVRLFIQYSLTNPPPLHFGTLGANLRVPVPAFEHFRGFRDALAMGTISSETGLDPTGLCWRPSRQSKVQSVVRALTDFFEWVDATSDDGSRFNPKYRGSIYDQLCAQAAFEEKRSRAFLGHTWGGDLGSASVSLVGSPKPPRTVSTSPPCFPDKLFERFLFDGFSVGGRYNFRNMLITLLLHGAGFRESEPFHLYVEDVVEDPAERGVALVRIFHPIDGQAPSSWRHSSGERISGNRREYLAKAYAISPRSRIRGPKHAGWKGGMHEDSRKLYKQAYWFGPEWGRLFWRIWLLYMSQIAALERNHPFAFVNTGRNSGEMYSISKYEMAHAAAVRRIGLEASKSNGLTPHGHRHAYAQRLMRCEVPSLFRQRMLHHASIDSQKIYTEPSMDDIRCELVRATVKLREISDVDPSRAADFAI
jgi:hypothetical protein